MRDCTKREVSQPVFEQYVKDHPQELRFDGLRYTHPVKLNGLTWNKPVAYKQDGKFYVIEDK